MLVMLRPRTIWMLAGLVLFVLLVREVGHVLSPFVLGTALAYFLDPLADRLERLGIGRAWAVAIIALVGLSAMIAVALWVLPTLIAQVRQAVEALPRAVRSGFDFLTVHFPELMEDGGFLRQFITDLFERIRLTALLLLGGTVSTVISAVGTIFIFIATATVSIYMLYDWDRILQGVNKRLPPEQAPLFRRLARDIDDVMTGFVRGQVIVGALLATFYSTVLMALGLNYGLLIGIASGLLNFIPYLGSFSGFILATGVALVQFWGDWWMVALVAFVFVFGQVAEGNFVTPRIVGDSVKLHPVFLLLSLAVGGTLFGFAGLLLAVPLGAAIGVVVRYFDAEYRASIRRRRTRAADRPRVD
ncbi:AI-2E family transporter [Paracoccus niistensis]|uniref:AI-2E family transporter n=1 Tax=Paracoccus niistensis TaxID=632935 RepID=A0ABV6I4J7_9RHOB